ncbi:hypothetical protein MGSAQ_002390 [marine sediment metagenome]|uniref:Uncharacterized protein n=1 Tax=marine sediment metagenome TaxID=412755 RepID=A0A1B6NRM4_9ZZZZ
MISLTSTCSALCRPSSLSKFGCFFIQCLLNVVLVKLFFGLTSSPSLLK